MTEPKKKQIQEETLRFTLEIEKKAFAEGAAAGYEAGYRSGFEDGKMISQNKPES